VLLPMDQLCYNDDSMLNNDAPTIAINNVSKYSVYANIFGSRVSFLIDTGAAVSLVSSEVWDHIKPKISPRLNYVNVKLVGVDGAPLQVQGSVTVELEMSGQIFAQKLIVANALTSEGILGLNFLEANECFELASRGKCVLAGPRFPCKLKDYTNRQPKCKLSYWRHSLLLPLVKWKFWG